MHVEEIIWDIVEDYQLGFNENEIRNWETEGAKIVSEFKKFYGRTPDFQDQSDYDFIREMLEDKML